MRTLPPSPRTARRGGFTFMEILFAVMILGIGFIMVAAMFPAALRQTQANVEENEFSAMSQVAEQELKSLSYNTDPRWAAHLTKVPAGTNPGNPPGWLDSLTVRFADTWAGNSVAPDPTITTQDVATGHPIPFSFHDWRLPGLYSAQVGVPSLDTAHAIDTTVDPGAALWDLVRGNMINREHPQNAWVALWARQATKVASTGQRIASPQLQLFIFPVRSRAKPAYDAQATLPGSTISNNPACDLTYTPANLDPTVLAFHYYPPTKGSTVAANSPGGVLEILKQQPRPQGGVAMNMVDISGSPKVNPVAEGAYLVVSDSQFQISAPFPKKYNGVVFRIGTEVADKDGNPGTSGGLFWSIASPNDVMNLPSEWPFLISSPDKIEATAFTASNQIFGLVIGRQPDPADPAEQTDTARTTASQQGALLNRTGIAQELNYYPSVIVVQHAGG